MNLSSRRPLCALLLSLSLVAASSVPNLPPPRLLLKMGEWGTAENQFSKPNGVAFDASGNMYVAEGSNDRIQKFDSHGNFLLMWGWGVDTGAAALQVCTGSCQKGDDGSGTGQFDEPYGVAVDAAGNVFVADFQNYRVQKFDGSGNFLLMWGWGVDDGDPEFQVCTSGCRKGIKGDGAGQLGPPADVEVDSTGNVYVSDMHNDRIQKFAGSGTYLGQRGSSGTGDGEFSAPWGVAIDSSDNIYVADFGNDRVQKFDSTLTFVTKWGSLGAGDNQFWGPAGVAVDGSGNVFVADLYNRRVKQSDTSGNLLQMWGWGVLDSSASFQVCTKDCKKGQSGDGDGQFLTIEYLEVDGDGNLYVADHGLHRIQKFGFSWLEFFIGETTAPPQPVALPALSIDR